MTTSDPIDRFRHLLLAAERAGVVEPTAMALATATPTGNPSVRMVLLKSADPSGFVFYTNLGSRKAGELLANPVAALCFHWQPLEAQVRIEGPVVRVSDADADEYFASRPRGSQVGAWASRQSQSLGSFTELEDRVAEIERTYANVAVPRPSFWSGFRLIPLRIEFWSGRPSRLHQREVFERESADQAWVTRLLYP